MRLLLEIISGCFAERGSTSRQSQLIRRFQSGSQADRDCHYRIDGDKQREQAVDEREVLATRPHLWLGRRQKDAGPSVSSVRSDMSIEGGGNAKGSLQMNQRRVFISQRGTAALYWR